MGTELWLMRLKFVLQKNGKHHVRKLWGYPCVAKISNIHPRVPQINWPSRLWREGYTSSKSATKDGREGPFNGGQQWPGWTSPPAKGLCSRETLCRRSLHFPFPLLECWENWTEQVRGVQLALCPWSLWGLYFLFGLYASDCEQWFNGLPPPPPREIRSFFLFKRKIKQMTATLSSCGECSNTRTKLEQGQQVIFLETAAFWIEFVEATVIKLWRQLWEVWKKLSSFPMITV